jgi:hypothetical protein
LIKIYKDKWNLLLVSKHIVRVVLNDHVLPVNVVVDHQAWLCIFIRALARSCSLIGCSIEMSSIRSFIFSSLFERFLVQVNQVLGYIAVLCNMIRITTAVALEGFLSFPQTLFFGFVLLVLDFLTFLDFTNILWWFVTIHLFHTLNYS